MALQELDLHLHYRPGTVNKNADALSRGPVQTQAAMTTDDTEHVVAKVTNPQSTDKDREDVTEGTEGTVAIVTNSQSTSMDGEEDVTLAERQNSNTELSPLSSI